ncbi:FtsB family cell division protein [[Mycobacterium] burgundiense]|uniref:Septum formation initiator family protein n=1 Tax=[Mycobacterium] burgundiense TaxID=3064286 RepID=A0ABM9LDX8_9MYCO|nr:septum formation initiator family protein [Mycolicibacterium sp. MU0053]CAJ1497416.1 septum formation initiator family protein [Mycolicibacterium sp. MU0053]
MSDAKRPDPKRRSPTSRPAAGGRGGPGGRGARKPVAKPPSSSTARKDTKPSSKPNDEKAKPEVIEPVRQSIAESAEQQSEQRMGFTARRAAVLAAVVCVLTLTIAGPVRTYFAQRTEMRQLSASEASLRAEIAELEEQKAKLADPVFIAAQARERLGFVMPGDIPYQVQLPPGAIVTDDLDDVPTALTNNDPWYTSLWKTIADEPHGAPPLLPAPPVVPGQVPPPPLPPEPGQPGG